MNKDIKFYDMSSLYKIGSSFYEDEKFLISSSCFDIFKEIFPFFSTYIDKYEIVDDSEIDEKDINLKELETCKFANDNIYIDEVIFVTGEEDIAKKAELFFGDTMIEIV